MSRKAVLLLTLLVFMPFIVWFLHVENNSLTVTTIDIESEALPESFSGLRIVHLSDLHNKTFGRDQQRLVEFVRELVSRGLGNSIIPQRLFNRPEVIVLTLLTK